MTARRWTRTRHSALVAIASLAVLASCGSDDGAQSDAAAELVVTTSVLGDVVTTMFGSAAAVEVVMPRGASPHDFQASAQQAATMRQADVLVVNGGGFELGLAGVIDGARADGVDVYEATDGVTGAPVDRHFFTDPVRMAEAARGIADHVFAASPALDTAEVRTSVDDYLDSLGSLDAEVRTILAPVDRRVLVTNHDVFAAFAARYDFEVVGVIVPGGSTSEQVSGGALDELAGVVAREQVPAIFADTSSPRRLAEALASEVGDVEVVELYSESLGDESSGASTYIDMLRTNARRIAEALAR